MTKSTSFVYLNPRPPFQGRLGSFIYSEIILLPLLQARYTYQGGKETAMCLLPLLPRRPCSSHHSPVQLALLPLHPNAVSRDAQSGITSDRSGT